MRGLLIVAAVALAGCGTPEQRADRQAEDRRQEQARLQAYREDLMRQCASIGYHYDTDGMRQCVLTLHGQNIQASQNQPQPQYPDFRQNNRRPPPVMTNCQTYAGQTFCTSR